jgi:membrane-bound lytic murein transglycosylase B
MQMLPLLVCVLLASCAAWRPQGGDSPQARGVRFHQFLVQLEAEAIARGLNAELLRQSYGGQPPAPLPELRQAEQNQAEFTDTLANYTSRAVSAARVARGRALMAEHATTLAKIERNTGVPANLMVALWGLESDFGRNAGNLPLLPSLISMAYKSPRSAMFRNEVLAALQIPAKTGQDVTQLKGSWAGATGQCQFMPSNVLKHARDGNADERIDIWGTPADVFASTANFIRQLGYQPTQLWRWRTTERLDLSGLDVNIRGLSEPLTRADWAKRGLQQGVKVPPTTKLRYYQPEGGEATYLVGPNYEAVLSWNYSSYFATSVFMLSEALAKAE